MRSSPASRWWLAILGGLGFRVYVGEEEEYVSNAGYLYRERSAHPHSLSSCSSSRTLARRVRSQAPWRAQSLKLAAVGLLDARRHGALQRFTRSAFGRMRRRSRVLGNTAACKPRGGGGALGSRPRRGTRIRSPAQLRHRHRGVLLPARREHARQRRRWHRRQDPQPSGRSRPSRRRSPASSWCVVRPGGTSSTLRGSTRALLIWILVVQITSSASSSS